MDLPGHPPPRPSRAGLIWSLYGALALVALLISAGRDHVNIYVSAAASAPRLPLASPLIGAAAGLAVVLLSRLSVTRFEWARQLHRDFHALLGPVTTHEIAVLAIASAIGEELLFRGALQPWIGLWPQAIVFALLHVGPGRRFLPWTAWALVMGVVFGCMFTWLGDLGAPIAAHVTINYLNLQFITRVELPLARTPHDTEPT